MAILLVGEGNFSFTVGFLESLLLKSSNACNEIGTKFSITATTFEKQSFDKFSKTNVTILETKGKSHNLN